MLRSLYNGVAGIKTQNTGMDVWANNISNVNTVGYKSSRPEFASILHQTSFISGNYPTSDQVGLGATVQTTALNMNSGGFQDSDNIFDFAINGDGFFGVKDENSRLIFTRNGGFDIDAAGNLVDAAGNFVQGTVNSVVQTTPSAHAIAEYGKTSAPTQAYTVANMDDISLAGEAEQKNIFLPSFLYQAGQPTTKVDIGGNLDSSFKSENIELELDKASYKSTIDADAKTISLSGNIFSSPNVTNYKQGDPLSIFVSDKSGKILNIPATINKDGTWSVDNYPITYMDTDSAEVKAVLNTTQEIANTQSLKAELYTSTNEKNILEIKFTKQIPSKGDSITWNATATITDPSGKVIAQKDGNLVFSNSKLVSTTLNEINGIALNYDGKSHDGTYNGLRTSYEPGATSSKVDGYSEGVLSEYAINGATTIVANLTNGNSFNMAKLALYHFQNDQGLEKLGENHYINTPNSGDPFFYRNKDGEIFYGSNIVSSKLENSNVSLAEALTQVIVTQKAYDANSKSITTSDDMLKTAIQMKNP
ncbi:MAG: flagellar hook-basal body complex protein [Campylobacter sp.]|nr:flagellar hook-basal body complex protein [Campylobacter sp.]